MLWLLRKMKNNIPGTQGVFWDKVASDSDIDGFSDEPVVQCDVQVFSKENTFVKVWYKW